MSVIPQGKKKKLSIKSCHSFLKAYQVASLPPQSKAAILAVGSKSRDVRTLHPQSSPAPPLRQQTQIRQAASHLGPRVLSPSGTSRCPQSTCLLPIFAQIWPAWQGFLSFTPVLSIPTLSHLLYFLQDSYHCIRHCLCCQNFLRSLWSTPYSIMSRAFEKSWFILSTFPFQCIDHHQAHSKCSMCFLTWWIKEWMKEVQMEFHFVK